ncbi:MAG TPA: Gfo/Idh/MocA family oxidoreductase [Aestuariivirga sp.]|nr:Gfo/Idh/MocA family oxidoreductase [Aestuariivirga sp.]
MASVSRVRLLILGTGGMATSHARLFGDDPRVDVVAACDVDAARAEAFATTHGIAKSFGGPDAALAWGKFDAVSNVTPDAVHHPTTMKVIAAGKHVLCEKPLAETFALADEMATAADKAGLVNMVNLSYRNVAALQKAQGLISSGAIGEVRHVEASYRQSWLVGNSWGDWRTDPKWLWRLSEAHGSRGVLGDVGIHILDFATYAIGMMPVSLQARLKTFDKAKDGKIGAYLLDANDSASLQVEFANGALGVIHASRFMTGYANTLKLDVFGTEGAIEINHGLEWTEIRMCSGEDVHNLAWRRVQTEPVPTIHRRFIDAIVTGGGGEPSFRRGADLQAVLDLCFSPAAAQGAAVSNNG